MKKNILLVIALMLFATFGAFAQVPADFSIQGYAENASGQAYNGTINVVFEIYDVQTGGTSIYSQTEALTATAGYFEFRTDEIIGSQITTQAKNQLYYQFTIEGVAQNRVAFAAVPYSVTSKWAESAFLADSATPSGPAGGHLEGTYPNPTLKEEIVGTLIENYVDNKGIQAVPKGPAGGDIGGNYPNELLIKDRAVKSNHIALNAVRTEHLAAGSVSLSKLARGSVSALTPNQILVWDPNFVNEDNSFGAWTLTDIGAASAGALSTLRNSLAEGQIPFYSSAIGATDEGVFNTASPLTVVNPTAATAVTSSVPLQYTGVTLSNDFMHNAPPAATELASVGYLRSQLPLISAANGNIPLLSTSFGSTQRMFINSPLNVLSGTAVTSNLRLWYDTTLATIANDYMPSATVYGRDLVTAQYVWDHTPTFNPMGSYDIVMNTSGAYPHDSNIHRLIPSPLMATGSGSATTPANVLSKGWMAYTGRLAENFYMPAPATITDSMLATVGYVKNNGVNLSAFTEGDILNVEVNDAVTPPAKSLVKSNFWSSNVDTIHLGDLTGLFPSDNPTDESWFPRELGDIDAGRHVNTMITGDVLFSPNTNNNKTDGLAFIWMPHHVLTIGAHHYANKSPYLNDNNVIAALNVFTLKPDANGTTTSNTSNIGIKIVPGLERNGTTSFDLAEEEDYHVGFMVDFTGGDVTHGTGGYFSFNGGDTARINDGYASAYWSAGLVVENFSISYNMSHIMHDLGMSMTPDPALLVVGTAEIQGPLVSKSFLLDDIVPNENPNQPVFSKEQYGTVFKLVADDANYQLQPGWDGQIVYFVNTTSAALTIRNITITGGQGSNITIPANSAVNLIYLFANRDDVANYSGTWYPVVAPTP